MWGVQKKSIKWKIKKAIEHEWHSLDGFSFIRPSKSVPSKTLDSMYILITVVTRDSHRAFHHTNTHTHPHIRIPAAPLVCVINCACFVLANGWLLIYACCNYRPTMSLGSSRQVSSRVDESSPVVMKPLATWWWQPNQPTHSPTLVWPEQWKFISRLSKCSAHLECRSKSSSILSFHWLESHTVLCVCVIFIQETTATW